MIDDTKDADSTNKHGKVFPAQELPALTKAGDNYKKALDYIANGGSVEDIAKKYYLSDGYLISILITYQLDYLI